MNPIKLFFFCHAGFEQQFIIYMKIFIWTCNCTSNRQCSWTPQGRKRRAGRPIAACHSSRGEGVVVKGICREFRATPLTGRLGANLGLAPLVGRPAGTPVGALGPCGSLQRCHSDRHGKRINLYKRPQLWGFLAAGPLITLPLGWSPVGISRSPLSAAIPCPPVQHV